MQMRLPENVSYIIGRLEALGYEAYAVGGCVRDTLLGRDPEDWDITTSAKPLEIKSAFKKTIDTGIQHGTVTVMRDHIGYEVTTYRIDGEYEDNRHPKNVEFTTNLKMDLERRDFTINAMAYNERVGLVDAFGGVEDLEQGIIRCVGDAGKRFDEDALRMLRAVRFAGQLGFTIEDRTKQAITTRVNNLKNISAERIRVELTKLLISKNSGQIRQGYETGMTAVFLPELDEMMNVEQKNPHHIYTVGEHSIRSVEIMNYFFSEKIEWCQEMGIYKSQWERGRCIAAKLSKKQHVMLCVTMLLHDIGKPKCFTEDQDGIGHFYGHPKVGEEMAVRIMKRLTFDNETIDMVRRLIRYHDYRFEPKEGAVRKAASKMGIPGMDLLFLVQYADIFAQNPNTYWEKCNRIDEGLIIYEKIVEQGDALTIKDLKISGKELLADGMKPGPGVGQVLKLLLEQVLEDPSLNQQETLLELARKLVSSQKIG